MKTYGKLSFLQEGLGEPRRQERDEFCSLGPIDLERVGSLSGADTLMIEFYRRVDVCIRQVREMNEKFAALSEEMSENLACMGAYRGLRIEDERQNIRNSLAKEFSGLLEKMRDDIHKLSMRVTAVQQEVARLKIQKIPELEAKIKELKSKFRAEWAQNKQVLYEQFVKKLDKRPCDVEGLLAKESYPIGKGKGLAVMQATGKSRYFA
eukprot:g19553.t1